MIKYKHIFLGFWFICFVGMSSLTFFIWNKNKSNEIKRKESVVITSPSVAVLSGNKTNGVSLQVAPNSIDSDLKQLSMSSGTSNKPPAPESSSPGALDPSTFAQYEKYKNDKTALFGEIQVGTGVELANDKKAAVAYKVWLTNGTLVDMSRTDDKGQLQPFIFTMGAHEVIAGWEQAMNGMKVGGTRLIIVPPSAGYGATAKDSIPANSVLVFQVQLLDVK